MMIVEFTCPYCLRSNHIPNEDFEDNVKCFYCENVFGVINDTELDIRLTCKEFKDALLIKGEDYGYQVH